MGLSIGDVIELDQSVENPLVVQVANKKQFYASVGKSRKRMGIQINGVYREHDDTQASYK